MRMIPWMVAGWAVGLGVMWILQGAMKPIIDLFSRL